MDIVQQTLAVVAVLGLLAASLWWLRRRGLAQLSFGDARRRSEHRLELLDKLRLTPQHSLLLVRVEDNTLLLVTSPTGCNSVEARGTRQSAEAIH